MNKKKGIEREERVAKGLDRLAMKLRGFLSRPADESKERKKRQDVRPLRLGVDYGTSRSKLVVTDYGSIEGERSFVVRPPPEYEGTGEYRIPSTVSIDGDAMYFGFAAESRARGSVAVYRSLKMLCAYPDRFYGDRAELPPGLNARDLSTLYVGYLIQLGQEAGNRYATRYRAESSIGITLGVPMAQLDNTGLLQMFVGIAREAFALREKIDLLNGADTAEAAQALVAVRESLSGSFPEEPRDWVRSEAEAALFWAHGAPQISHGRYACVDVGAGTTGASWFHINPARSGGVLVKDRLAFYGAACSPPGCDAIDAKLATHLGLPTSAETRGQEAKLLERLQAAGRVEVDEVLGEIARVYGLASKEAFEKEKSYMRWKHVGRVFFLGGGSKLEAVRQRLIAQKLDWLMDDPIAEPGVPVDLTEEDGGELREDPTFLLVSYGLARRLADVPDIYRPSEVPNFKPELRVRERPSWQDHYT